MAIEEDFTMVEVDLTSIDLDKIERIYTAIAQLLVANGVEKTPLGWTELLLVFLGLVAQMELPDDTCPLCTIDGILHTLWRHFRSVPGEEGHDHAVH